MPRFDIGAQRRRSASAPPHSEAPQAKAARMLTPDIPRVRTFSPAKLPAPVPDVSPDWDEPGEEPDDGEDYEEEDSDAISIGDVAREAASIYLGRQEPQQESPRAQLRREYQSLRDAGLTDAQAQAGLQARPKRLTPQDQREDRERLYSELEARGGTEVAIATVVRALVAQAQAGQLKMLPAPTKTQGAVPLAAPLGYGLPVQVAARSHALPYSSRQARTSGLHTAAIAYEGKVRGR